MLTVCCVLKSGGIYKKEHVNILKSMVGRNLSIDHKFVCLSDCDVECERIPLINNLQGWWSKLELFRPGLFDGPVLFLDLDTVIVNSLDLLIEKINGPLHLATNVLYVAHAYGCSNHAASPIMHWYGDYSKIYEDFMVDSAKFMNMPKIATNLGDQGFICHHSLYKNHRIQDDLPSNFITSYTKINMSSGRTPSLLKKASIVCFYDKDKPWTVNYKWVKEYYHE